MVDDERVFVCVYNKKKGKEEKTANEEEETRMGMTYESCRNRGSL